MDIRAVRAAAAIRAGLVRADSTSVPAEIEGSVVTNALKAGIAKTAKAAPTAGRSATASRTETASLAASPTAMRDGKPYGKPGSKPYGNRDGKPSGDRDRKPYGSRDGKPYGDRDRKPYGDRDRKPYGKRDGKPSGDRKSFGGSRFDDRKGAPRGGKPFKKYDGGQRRFGSSQGRFDGKRDGSFDRRKFNDEKPRMTDDVQVQSIDERAVPECRFRRDVCFS